VDLAATMEISVLPPAGEFSQFAFRSWNDVAAWFQRKSLPARRDAGTDPVAAGADPRLAAATWVQEKIRYVAVEVGEGGYVPREPALVTRRLYGDCKDKSFLLLALLGKRGIEAFPVLTRARSAGWIDPEFPSPIQFNHLILAVRVPAKTGLPAEIMLSDGPAVLFDATDAWTPWGRIPGELQGSRGLVVRANGGELMDFPFAPPTVNRMERVVEGSLSETGSLTAEVVEKTDGALGERALYQSWTPQQRTDVFAGYAADHVTGSRASDVSFSHLEERSTPMEARFKISAPGFLRRTGGLVLLPVTPFSVAPDRVLRGGERRSPINLGVPARYELKTRLKLPYGHVSDGLPDPVEAENAWALYRLVVTEEAGHILARELYEVRKPLVPTSELAAWKSFEAAVAKGSGARAVIMTKPAS
jgi:hypothetical protein